MNNRYTIRISQPFLTPGLSLEMETNSQELLKSVKQLFTDVIEIKKLEQFAQNEANVNQLTK